MYMENQFKDKCWFLQEWRIYPAHYLIPYTLTAPETEHTFKMDWDLVFSIYLFIIWLSIHNKEIVGDSATLISSYDNIHWPAH